jgi:hypothetical protein
MGTPVQTEDVLDIRVIAELLPVDLMADLFAVVILVYNRFIFWVHYIYL